MLSSGGNIMTNNPHDVYRQFSHVNKFLSKTDDYRNEDKINDKNELLSSASDENIFKKAKSDIKAKGHI